MDDLNDNLEGLEFLLITVELRGWKPGPYKGYSKRFFGKDRAETVYWFYKWWHSLPDKSPTKNARLTYVSMYWVPVLAQANLIVRERNDLNHNR